MGWGGSGALEMSVSFSSPRHNRSCDEIFESQRSGAVFTPKREVTDFYWYRLYIVSKPYASIYIYIYLYWFTQKQLVDTAKRSCSAGTRCLSCAVSSTPPNLGLGSRICPLKTQYVRPATLLATSSLTEERINRDVNQSAKKKPTKNPFLPHMESRRRS